MGTENLFSEGSAVRKSIRHLIMAALFCHVLVSPVNAVLVTNLEQLTFGSIQESEPRFSFDGTSIVYRNLHSPYSWDNCDIWTMNNDGSAQTRVTSDWRGEFNPSFTPDGQITYTKEFGSNNYDLWMVDADGSDPYSFIGGSLRQSNADWNPSGSKLAYKSEYTVNSGEIWAASADGTYTAKLTDHTVDGANQDYPVWSTSGGTLAYGSQATSSSGFDIWLRESDGSKYQITSGIGSEAPMFWGPDDSYLGYVLGGDLYRYDFASGMDELLLSVPDKTIDWADISPDGSKLVFGSSDGTIGGGHIWTADVFEESPEPREPEIYGIFVGCHNKSLNLYGDVIDMRADLSAWGLHDTLSENLRNFHGIVLDGDTPEGYVSEEKLQATISDLKKPGAMLPGDKLILYMHAHGGSQNQGTETTSLGLSPGDEYLALANLVCDDELTVYLDGLDNIEKWVFIDACHSGGFWGNNNPQDLPGDLEQLKNIAFFASAEELFNTVFIDDAPGVWSSHLITAFSRNPLGYLWADLNFDQEIDWYELDIWLLPFPTGIEGFEEGSLVYEMGFGDPVIFTSDMWKPVSFVSDDFTGLSGGFEVIPAPGAFLLGSVGLIFAGWKLHKRENQS